MEKIEFLESVNELLKKANKIAFDDYYQAVFVVKEFKTFVANHNSILNKYTLDNISSIETDFQNMKTEKKIDKKIDHWNSAVQDLKADIESMLDENKFTV